MSTELSQEEVNSLIEACISATKFSLSPYSGYRVGAALLVANSGNATAEPSHIVLGCNVENAAYPDGCCAEKTAVVKAVSEGHKRFRALAVTVAVSNGDDHPRMCGSCRQMMAEFCDDRLPIYLVRFRDKDCRMVRLEDYLPGAFRPEMLQEGSG